MIAIETGVPMPSPSAPHPNTKYPFRRLKVGESFAVENRTAHTMRAIARHHAEATGWTFKVRKVDGGARVWRTA